MDKDNKSAEPVEPYEPPCVEATLTPEELEREVLYAGLGTLPPP
jgi:hypothetical protein